jgi:hypothetical protein
MKIDTKKYDGANRPDETPKSFAPKEWIEAERNGGYWAVVNGHQAAGVVAEALNAILVHRAGASSASGKIVR